MFHARLMTAADLALGLRLKDQAGWNQTEADWLRFLELEPEGCFVAEWDGHPAGTTTTCILGTVGWIAMVLVDEASRGRGIGTRLVRHAVAYLHGRGLRTVRLDATALGRPVYERLGFQADYELARFQGTAAAPGSIESAVAPAEAGDLGAIARLDESLTGTRRHRLLERLFVEAPQRCAKILRQGRLTGYAMWREGSRARILGPSAATDARDGVALMDWALAQCQDRPVFVDVPIDNPAAMDWARVRGLDVQRRFLRMHLGDSIHDRPECLWASSGPEKG